VVVKETIQSRNNNNSSDPWEDEVYDALPISDTISTSEMVVNNTNEILLPVVYQYQSPEDPEKTQGILNLDVNNARVLSSYTDVRTVTGNGLLEWDAVDSGVNMPILNYKVNVNVSKIINIIYFSPTISSTSKFTFNDFTYNDSSTSYSVNLSSYESCVCILEYNNYYFIMFISNSTSSVKNFSVPGNSYYYVYGSNLATSVILFDENQNPVCCLFDSLSNDNNNSTTYLYKNGFNIS
jgi:hypothetical protein